MVRTLDGSPWACAHVTLVSNPFAQNESLGHVDRLHVLADERGHFNARLLRGRSYTVWGWSQPQAEIARVTRICHDVIAGESIHLSESDTPRHAYRVALDGLAAWSSHAPIEARIRCTTSSNTLSLPVEIDADGTGQLPPVPTDAAYLEVTAHSGQPLLIPSPRLELRSDKPKSQAKWSIPPPFPVLVKVIAQRDRAPIAGAWIFHKTRNVKSIIATTDDHGFAVVHWPVALNSRRTVFGYAGKPGFADRIGNLEPPTDGERDVERLRAKDRPDIVFPLTRSTKVTGRLWIGDEPAANTPLALTGGGGIPTYWKTDADGRLAATLPYARHGYRLCAVLDAAQIQKLSRTRTPLTPTVWIAASSRPIQTNIELGDIHLDRLHQVRLTVRNSDGSPAGAARLYVVRSTLNYNRTAALRYVANRRGRLCLLMPQVEALTIGAWSHGAVGACEVDLSGEPKATQAIDLELMPRTSVSGRVVDQDGAPVSGVRIWPGLYGTAARGPERLLLQIQQSRATSDDEGRFAIDLPLNRAHYKLYGYLRRGSQTHRLVEEQIELREKSITGLQLNLVLPAAPPHSGPGRR